MEDAHSRLLALRRTLSWYALAGVLIALIVWGAAVLLTLLFAQGTLDLSWLYYASTFIYTAAPVIAGVLVAFWLVARIWIRNLNPLSVNDDDDREF